MNKDRLTSLRLGLLLSMALLIAPCDGMCTAPPPIASSPTPAPSSPVLSISAMPRLDPFPTAATQYAGLAVQAFDLAYSAGARGQMSTWTWKALEPVAGKHDAKSLADLDAAIVNAERHGMVQYIGIQLINTTVLEVPAGLERLPFDDVTMQIRFKALLDRVVTPNRGRIRYLSIGNEVDAYLRTHPADWPRYKAFFARMAAYARSLDPALQVGVTGTADGALSQSTAELRDLDAAADVVILTYYPLGFSTQGKVTVRDPAVVAGDFAAMLAFAAAKPLVLQEVGYPAAASTGSSPARQARFFSNVFAAWRENSGRMPFVNLFLLHDFTSRMCTDFARYYGASGSANFSDFLCTLGLREANGTPRPAWQTVVDEATAASRLSKPTRLKQ